jgi:deoxycytidylate deaminase
MKEKHIGVRIKQCLALAELSNCSRRKFGAMLIDPSRNVILADGYNGGPRGGGKLCRGTWCERDGIQDEDVSIEVENILEYHAPRVPPYRAQEVKVLIKGQKEWSKKVVKAEGKSQAIEEATAEKLRLLKKYTPIESGTRTERGCHHAEANVICNAADSGVSTRGALLIVTGEPCLSCSKYIHHSGITKVICVENGYKGGKDGPEYLERHGIEVEYTKGPGDPRECKQTT